MPPNFFRFCLDYWIYIHINKYKIIVQQLNIKIRYTIPYDFYSGYSINNDNEACDGGIMKGITCKVIIW